MTAAAAAFFHVRVLLPIFLTSEIVWAGTLECCGDIGFCHSDCNLITLFAETYIKPFPSLQCITAKQMRTNTGRPSSLSLVLI